jgi:ApaG protein
MDVLITNGITVIVEHFYHPRYSRPVEGQYVFAYRITIENNSSETVQLMRRHWYIWESTGLQREVEGEGVVGEQPTLEPGQRHQYVSWCHLSSGMGSMHGHYTMRNCVDDASFQVGIPRFWLQAEPLLS